MAVRHQSANDQRWSIELMHTDGTTHRSVPISFRAGAGTRNPWIRDDGAELIVASPDCPEQPKSRCLRGATFYRLDVVTGKATAIASIPSSTRNDDFMVSNDGKSLVYPREIETWLGFYDFDFSEVLKSVRP